MKNLSRFKKANEGQLSELFKMPDENEVFRQAQIIH